MFSSPPLPAYPGHSFTPAAEATYHTAHGEALAFLFELFQMLPAVKITGSGIMGLGMVEAGGATLMGTTSAVGLAPPTVLNLSVFRNLTTLHLQRIDVHALRGVQALRPRLQRLSCRRGLTTLKAFFGECGGDMVRADAGC